MVGSAGWEPLEGGIGKSLEAPRHSGISLDGVTLAQVVPKDHSSHQF